MVLGLGATYVQQAGPEMITYLTERFHAETPQGIELDLRMTTNAVLLTPDNLKLMRDQLKLAFNGAAATGHHVSLDSFDQLQLQPGVIARQIGVDALSDKCKACPIRDICGGGLYAHRYKRGIGYLNPSVYCADLSRLITHIIDRVAKDVLS